jgi:hypothetical protein
MHDQIHILLIGTRISRRAVEIAFFGQVLTPEAPIPKRLYLKFFLPL